MSQLRRIKININPNIFKVMGCKIAHNCKPKGFGMPTCDMVIDDYIGIKHTSMGDELVYDNMYYNKYKKIIGDYLCEYLTQQGYTVEDDVNQENRVLIVRNY